ncbi:MAG: endonuclease/exonuclease/phosphatase family protein [Planctomycetota bacterium]
MNNAVQGKPSTNARTNNDFIAPWIHPKWALMPILLVSFAINLSSWDAQGSEPSEKQVARQPSLPDAKDEVVRGLGLGSAPRKDQAVEITIASYNVQCRPRIDDAAEKLPKISPLLNRFDVVLIQECFHGHALLWSRATFPNKVYFGRPAKNRVTNSGLSILTRLPMGEAEMEHFRSVGEFQNRLASKGILLVRTSVAGIPLDVYDTHMEAGHSQAAQRARLDQARHMVEFVAKHSPAGHAVIVMGDFNMGPRRAGKNWKEHTPCHYNSEEDFVHRTAAYQVMFDGLKAKDASDVLHGPTDDGIERLLFREGTLCKMEPLSCGFDGETFRRENGTSLSDGSPLIVRLRISPIKKN